jgi:hypothetical protein
MIVKPYADTNYISNPMGVPAHDFVKLTYDGSGNLTNVEYFIGESQDTGTKVAEQELVYDGSGNLTSVERVE